MPAPTPHSIYRLLYKEREALVLVKMGCDVAAHLFPNDLQVREDQAVATALLDSFDTLHADEWNANKPWYEKRLAK